MRYFKLAALLAVVSCSSPAPGTPPAETPAAPKTIRQLTSAQVFATYLRDSFSHPIPPIGEHWYVVIPAVGCLGCAHAELRNLAGTAWAPNVTVISSGLLRDLTAAERTSLARYAHLLADTLRTADNTLDRLNLPFSTLTGVVRTRDGQAVEFVPFDNDSYKRVFAALPKRLP